MAERGRISAMEFRFRLGGMQGPLTSPHSKQIFHISGVHFVHLAGIDGQQWRLQPDRHRSGIDLDFFTDQIVYIGPERVLRLKEGRGKWDDFLDFSFFFFF